MHHELCRRAARPRGTYPDTPLCRVPPRYGGPTFLRTSCPSPVSLLVKSSSGCGGCTRLCEGRGSGSIPGGDTRVRVEMTMAKQVFYRQCRLVKRLEAGELVLVSQGSRNRTLLRPKRGETARRRRRVGRRVGRRRRGDEPVAGRSGSGLPPTEHGAPARDRRRRNRAEGLSNNSTRCSGGPGEVACKTLPIRGFDSHWRLFSGSGAPSRLSWVCDGTLPCPLLPRPHNRPSGVRDRLP